MHMYMYMYIYAIWVQYMQVLQCRYGGMKRTIIYTVNEDLTIHSYPHSPPTFTSLFPTSPLPLFPPHLEHISHVSRVKFCQFPSLGPFPYHNLQVITARGQTVPFVGKMDAVDAPLVFLELSLELEPLDMRFKRVEIRFERREGEVGIDTELPRRQLLDTAGAAQRSTEFGLNGW